MNPHRCDPRRRRRPPSPLNVLDVNVVRGNQFAALTPPATPATQTAAAPAAARTRYRPGVWAAVA